MTERSGEPLGSGPYGLLIPGDLDDPLALPEARKDEEAGMEQRVLARLDELAELLERRQARHEARVVERLGRIGTEVSCLASRQRLEAVRANEREAVLHGIREWLESSWARYMQGADRAEAAFQEIGRKLDWVIDDSRELRRRVSPARREGGIVWAAMLSGLMSGALIMVVVAVAAGLVDVSFGWKGNGVGAGASLERRPAPSRLDVAPGVVVPAGRERPMPEAVPPSRAELPPLLAAPDLNPGDVVPRVGSPPRFEEPVRNPREFVLPPGEEPLRGQHLDRVEERRRSMQAPPSLAVHPDLAPVDRKNVEEVPGREDREVGPDRQDFRVDASP